MSLRDFVVFRVGKIIPDSIWIQIKFLQHFGRICNLKQPETFNEKMQWLKLHDRKQVYSSMVDKYSVKEIVADKIGEKFVIPAVGGPWKTFDEIDFNQLPQQFVLKTTHDCGGVVICKDKSKLDTAAAERFLKRHLTIDYYMTTREWPYKNVVPKIFAEEFVEDKGNAVLPVYKILCFEGRPQIIQTIQNDKTPYETVDYFDVNWNRLNMRQNYPNSPILLQKPEKLDEMLSIAEKLSEGMHFIRIDLYVINGEIKFSEFTFYSDAGLAQFEPADLDAKLGQLIKLK